MTTEFYFLVLVCGAFGVFVLAPVLGTVREKSYARARSRHSRARRR